VTDEHMENVLVRCGPYGPTYGPGEEAPFSAIFVCKRGTVLIPVGVQLPKGEVCTVRGEAPKTTARSSTENVPAR
jgi:hypothetical protein